GKCDEIADRCIDGYYLPATNREKFARRAGVSRLDGGDFKGRIGVRGHGRERRWRRRDRPGGVCCDAREIQRNGSAALSERACNGPGVAAHTAFVSRANPRDSEFEGGTLNRNAAGSHS